MQQAYINMEACCITINTQLFHAMSLPGISPSIPLLVSKSVTICIGKFLKVCTIYLSCSSHEIHQTYNVKLFHDK